ncbi:VacJ family lipoprotein [Alkalilacustris brevis]|uniref:MlaA family lipoprotein n=1 Tax=Alkalilacustris brevis TaxID=2026338 RepID=UPI001EE46638|nr:VacJ family lipoprotein [Alkalilacustris brevis]
MWDPYEAENRARHAENRAVDTALLRRSAHAYGETVPEPVRRAVGNFAGNLSLPGAAVNSLLQGRPDAVVENTFRFLINSTLGLAGLFDPATEFGLHGRPTDFGETLHVWGAPEGAYLELPFIGPSTERDAVGFVADIALDPVRILLPRDARGLAFGSRFGALIGDRYEYSGLIDSTLYESADSYAQARLIYLQSRRFQLGDESFTTYFDPYEELYGD